MKTKVFEYNSIFPHKFTEAHANSHQYVCFQNDYVYSKAQKTLKKLQDSSTPTLYFFLRHNHLMIHVILLPELSDLLCSVEHSLCLSPLSQLLLINFHALPYITSMPCGREAARFMFAFMIERTWVPVRAHTLACLEDVCVCKCVSALHFSVCEWEIAVFWVQGRSSLLKIPLTIPCTSSGSSGGGSSGGGGSDGGGSSSNSSLITMRKEHQLG